VAADVDAVVSTGGSEATRAGVGSLRTPLRPIGIAPLAHDYTDVRHDSRWEQMSAQDDQHEPHEQDQGHDTEDPGRPEDDGVIKVALR